MFSAARLKILCASACLCATLDTNAAGKDLIDLPDHTLARFDFSGVQIGQTFSQFTHDFPTAKRDEKFDVGLGLTCYEVQDLQGADAARFYFLDNTLYQFEIDYKTPGLERQGGAQQLLRKLVDSLGPAQHVDANRHTWQQPGCGRRADFYTWPSAAQLLITDIGQSAIVDQRLARAADQSVQTPGL